MTYSSGGLIQAADYNTFATGTAGGTPDPNVANINTLWGVGVGDKGWGQTELTAVSAGATVTATQWASMFSAFTSGAAQTNTTVTAITNPVVGNTIDVKTNFSSNLSTIFTNRNNAAAVGSTISASGDLVRSTSWATSLTATHTVTFASANAMRYFFNAGGRITWAATRTGGSATDINTSWSNLLTACGTLNWTTGTTTQTIAGSSYTGTTKVGGSGTPTVLQTGIGFYDLTASNQELFKQFSTAYLYDGNNVDVDVRLDASPGSSTVMTITVVYTDAASEAEDTVDGTLTSSVRAIAPSTSNLSASWGTPALGGSITGS